MVKLASRSSDAYTTTDLVVGDADVVTEPCTVKTGQDLAANTVVGRVTKGAASAAKQSGTGDGTISAVTLGQDAIVGVYILTGKSEASDGGTFEVKDPNGALLDDLTVGVAYVSDHINLTVNDGAADWDIGDIIHVTVAAGDGDVVACALDATDGSEVPVGILVNAIDASGGDAAGSIYTAGEFNQDKLVWDASFTTDALKRNAFDRTPIHIKKPAYSVG